MLKFFSIIFVAFLVQGAISQKIMDGQCPDVKPILGYTPKGLDGHWYGYERFPKFTPILNNTKCVEAEHITDGNNVQLVGYGINVDTGASVQITYDIVSLGEGRLIFPLTPNATSANAYVLATDYKKYVSVFACINVSETQYAASALILVTDLNVNQTYITKARNAFKAVKLKSKLFIRYNQKKCPAN